MKLVKDEEVLQRLSMSVPDDCATPSAVLSAVEAATPLLENAVGTSFARQTNKDYFRYYPHAYKQSSPRIILNTTNGFVDATQAINVYASSNSERVTEDTDLLIDSTYYEVMSVEGRVYLYMTPAISNESLLITYTSGFTSSSGIYQNVPRWLQEAATTLAIRIMHNETNTYNKKELKNMSRGISMEAAAMVHNHVRLRMNGIFPVRASQAAA